MQVSKWVTLGVGALCLVAVAAVLNAQHLYYMAAILLTLPGVSYGLGWYALRGLTFARELPTGVWEGEESSLVYAARNQTRLTRFFLAIHEPLPSWIESLDTEPPLFNVGAEETTRVAHRIRFRKRGVYKMQWFDVTAIDPLGVFAFTRRVHTEGEIVVYPMPQSMRPVSLTGAERYGWQEFTSVALRGGSVDPDGVRQYVPGDPLRRIHWRQTARTGKLAVIEFEEAQSVNLVVALDLQRGSDIGKDTETTLEYAVRLTASLAQQATQQGASVRLLFPDDAIEGAEEIGSLAAVSEPGRGQEHLFLILDALARVQADALQPISGLISEKVGSLLPGTTLLVVTSRPDTGLPSALTRYTSTGANVAVIYIDTESFPGGKGRVSEAELQRFFAELLSVNVYPFVLRKNQQGDLFPEAVTHVYFHSPGQS
jgi:uncharacterized protein (DUF58 family)